MLPKTPTFLLALLSFSLLSECKLANEASIHSVRKFPDGFIFGAATAAYQVEGAWDVDGKSENIWDHMTHNNPCVIKDCQNGDIANDSYNQYKRDVEMMRELGLDVYRFSISWGRILPTSFPDRVNQAGVNYYNNLINEMLKYNIEPIVTINHWDITQKLQEMGGWINPHVVDWFADYSRVLFELFGDRVKYWVTINEPREICYQGYGSVTKAPRLNISGYAEYLCAKNLLIAHATVYHMYDKEYRPTQNGVIGISICSHWHEPETEEYTEIAEQLLEFELGTYANPIFSAAGDWPAVMKEKIAAKSTAQGFKRSRLPEFTPEEVELVRGTSDFFGLNHYTTYLVYQNATLNGYYAVPSYYDDIGAILYQPSEWETAESQWLKVIPWGFYKLLTHIREVYNNPTDDDRITYYHSYLNAMLDAIDEGSDISLYCAWSLMDNFEWMAGYTEPFGLYGVDYTSPERTRTPRKSAYVYKEIIRTRALDQHYELDTTHMIIDEGH